MEENIFKKVRTAVTDPEKVRRNDPGHPDVCNVFTYHQKFNPDEIDEIREDCKSGLLGCVACKQNCAKKIADYFEPMREKRVHYEQKMDDVHDILNDGIKRARKVAEETMSDVHKAMKMG